MTNLTTAQSNTTIHQLDEEEEVMFWVHLFEKILYFLYSLVFTFGFTGNLTVIYVIVNSIYACRYSLTSTTTNNLNNTPASCKNNNFNNSISEYNSSKYIPADADQKENNTQTSYLKTNRILREKLAITNFYLLNLAISDFFYVVFIPILIITMYYEKWIFGSFMCKLYLTMAYLCQFSSVFILVILSIDRYMSVLYPGKVASLRNSLRAKLIIIFTWILAILFSLPIVILTKLHNVGSDTWQCAIEWPEQWHQHKNFHFRNNTIELLCSNNINHDIIHTESHFHNIFDEYLPPLYAFTIYSFLVNYLIPVSLISVLYTLILKRLFRLRRQQCFAYASKTKKRTHKRITKMVLAIIICYLASWSPYWFVQIFHYIYQHLLHKSNSILLAIISHSAQVIAYFSSAINPFIYSYMNESFRNDLKASVRKLTCCCCFDASKRNDSINEKNKMRDRAAYNKKINNKGDNKKMIYNDYSIRSPTCKKDDKLFVSSSSSSSKNNPSNLNLMPSSAIPLASSSTSFDTTKISTTNNNSGNFNEQVMFIDEKQVTQC
jgi:hypothetical protein